MYVRCLSAGESGIDATTFHCQLDGALRRYQCANGKETFRSPCACSCDGPARHSLCESVKKVCCSPVYPCLPPVSLPCLHEMRRGGVPSAFSLLSVVEYEYILRARVCRVPTLLCMLWMHLIHEYMSEVCSVIHVGCCAVLL